MYRVAIGNLTAHTAGRLPLPAIAAGRDRKDPVLYRLLLLIFVLALPFAADARVVSMADEARIETTPFVATQGCMNLNQAIESVRRRGDVERVLDAQTRVEGGREVHHIKVMTKNGTVKTIRVNGCRR